MTADDERQCALAGKLAEDHIRRLEYVQTSTLLMGMLPLIYGVLTWVFGEQLWSTTPVYRTALSVPGAPQSWGTLFIVMGVVLIWSVRKEDHRRVTFASLGTATVLSMFMVTFGWEAIANEQSSALPPALVYGIFSLLFLNRAKLAWLSARAG